MSALADFLLARIAEDEAAARAATPGPWQWEPPDDSSKWPTGDQSLVAGDAAVLYGWGYDASGIDATDADREHIARHNPARVLAECEAKRRIVKACQERRDAAEGELYAELLADDALRLLALPYADHPDYADHPSYADHPDAEEW